MGDREMCIRDRGGADIVVLTQSDTRPGGHRLLPQIQVRQAWHQAPLIELKDLLLDVYKRQI